MKIIFPIVLLAFSESCSCDGEVYVGSSTCAAPMAGVDTSRNSESCE